MKKALLLSALFFVFLHVHAQLDPSFGTGGFVRLGVNYRSTAFQSGGRLIGAQATTDGFSLTRYKSDGTLDESFGSGGTLTMQVPGISGTPRV